MELTVLMTNEQANVFRIDNPFPEYYFDGELYAHYVKLNISRSWYWVGWDNTATISRKSLPQLTYEQFINLPTPITYMELKNNYPEFFI